ncbi:hypothetical protein Dcar01_00997 [Deinococcus carri]|uniref:Uncharacterized protein n=2 Tax=Deinococcus TaxID=1298 RepID=A0ABP9XHB2_9DEIO
MALYTLTSALQPLFRPWGGWRELLASWNTASRAARLPLLLTILTLVALDFTRYVLATLLALFAAGLAALIGVGYVGIMLFAVLFSGLVGGAFAARDVPAGCAWNDCGQSRNWP